MLPSLRSHEEYIPFVSQQLNHVTVPEANKDVVETLKLLALTPLRLLFLRHLIRFKPLTKNTRVS
ncbi:hypothetical protein FJZ31_25785 [Candidatus Poribacteria bacterium]|nr:hypothetical protein [Candidatus Poribacteria bacterium]